MNRRYMVDALGAMKSHTAQGLVADLVLKSSIHSEELVDSVLVNAIARGVPPSPVNIINPRINSMKSHRTHAK